LSKLTRTSDSCLSPFRLNRDGASDTVVTSASRAARATEPAASSMKASIGSEPGNSQ